MKPVDINVGNAMAGTALKVTIRPVRVWLLRVRIWLGISLIKIAALVMGVGEVRVEVQDE